MQDLLGDDFGGWGQNGEVGCALYGIEVNGRVLRSVCHDLQRTQVALLCALKDKGRILNSVQPEERRAQYDFFLVGDIERQVLGAIASYISHRSEGKDGPESGRTLGR